MKQLLNNSGSDRMECGSVTFQGQGTPSNKHGEATELKMKVEKHTSQETDGLGHWWVKVTTFNFLSNTV